MHWFKRHPQFLRQESESLGKDGNYHQLFQVRNELFISHGEILVRLRSIHRFPVLIVYPNSTPFELPVIFILQERLEESLVTELSKLDLYDVYQRVKPYVKFYYQLRHQNASGALCILEWDNLDDGTLYLGISTILKRIRDWCAGTLTGVFPPDSQEVEFASHFNDVEPDIRFIYPGILLDPELRLGEAFSQLYTVLPKLPGHAEDYRIYMACLNVGENQAGLVKEVDFHTPGLFLGESVKSAAELYASAGALQAKLETGEWLKCFWFHIDLTPEPFENMEGLLTLIGKGDRNEALSILFRTVYQQLRGKPDYFFIGLRFPNRQGELEFQLFKVYKNATIQPTIFEGSTEEKMEPFLASYTRIAAVESEKLTDENFHLRNAGRADRRKLAGKIFNVIGTGALGGEIADSINKAGPGAIQLFDNQRLKAHNTVRHLAGLNQIGLPKVIAVAQLLRQHNPFVQVETVMQNVNHFAIQEWLSDGSVSVSSMADDNVEAYLNERAVLAGKTVFYVRALRGGKAARIFRVIPGRDACFQCLNLYREEKSGSFVDIPEDETLPTLKNECNNPVRPASAADLKLIAAMASRILLDHVQEEVAAENHWIWSSEPLESLPAVQPWQLQASSLPPHPGCLYCHHDQQLQVKFSKAALAMMQQLVAAEPAVETGGVLAGFTDRDGNLEVRFASGPGPKAVRTPRRFEKDEAFCQAFLDDLARENGAVYLGEWHSHPSANNKPSGTDLKSLSEIAVQKEYLTERPLMVILSDTGVPSFTIHPAHKIHYEVEPEMLD